MSILDRQPPRPDAARDYGLSLVNDTRTVPEATPEQRDAAIRFVACGARDADDLRDLLRVLGILPWPGPDPDPEPEPARVDLLDAAGRVRRCGKGLHWMTADNIRWRARGGKQSPECAACSRARNQRHDRKRGRR